MNKGLKINMHTKLKRAHQLLMMFGLDFLKMARAIRGIPYYYKNFKILKQQEKNNKKKFPFSTLYPCLNDRFADSGSAKGHYFHQDL